MRIHDIMERMNDVGMRKVWSGAVVINIAGVDVFLRMGQTWTFDKINLIMTHVEGQRGLCD